MSSKKPLNLTINEKVLELASRIMELRGHTSISAFVEELIRDEFERRSGPMTFSPSASDDLSKAKGLAAAGLAKTQVLKQRAVRKS